MADLKQTPQMWRTHLVDEIVVGYYDEAGDWHDIVSVNGDYADPEQWPVMAARAQLIAAAPELLAALHDLRSFVAVMVGRGPEASIPETIATPLGVQVKIGSIMADAAAAIAKAEGRS